jgi:ABC-type multidrug transport system fused ATPase/permease subunit
MFKIKDINYIFTRKELIFTCIIFFGVLITTILDVLSFTTIIPIFQIIFLNKIPEIDFLNSFFNHYNLTFNIKILILLIFICLFFIKNTLIIIFNYYFINFFQKTNTRISTDLFNFYLNQEYVSFLKFSSENFLQKATNDVNNLNTWLVSFINFSTEIIFVIGISILLLAVNSKIFLFSFFIFIIVILFYVYFFKNRLKSWADNYRKSTGRTQDLVIEGLKGFKDLIIYKQNSVFINNFSHNINLSNYSISRINFLNNVQKYWLEIIGVLAIAIALLYFILTDSDISRLTPIFGLFIITTFRLLSSFSRIILHGQSLKFYFPSFSAVADEFKRLVKKKDLNFDNSFIFNKVIEIKNVSFLYPNSDNKIVDSINLKFNKNQCVGIVGKNGSGKSTFLNLLAGLIEPSEGKIIIDDIYNLYANRIKWIERLSYVQQNIFLLDASIKENIILENNDSKVNYYQYDKVINVLKLEDYFKDQPNGLNTKIGIDGISLSGGQKQLISLARALYKDSDVLILDEPTSALDTIKIELFRELILTLKKTKTIFFVTHNKDYFYDSFDQLIEIKSGKMNILQN